MPQYQYLDFKCPPECIPLSRLVSSIHGNIITKAPHQEGVVWGHYHHNGKEVRLPEKLNG